MDTIVIKIVGYVYLYNILNEIFGNFAQKELYSYFKRMVRANHMLAKVHVWFNYGQNKVSGVDVRAVSCIAVYFVALKRYISGEWVSYQILQASKANF